MAPHNQSQPGVYQLKDQLESLAHESRVKKYMYDVDLTNASSGNLSFGIDIAHNGLEDYFHFNFENDVNSVNKFISFCKNVIENPQYYTNSKFSICAADNLNQSRAKFSCNNNVITFRYEIGFSSATKRITLDNFMPIVNCVYEDCRYLIE
jgi:hypothetical protein